MKHVAAYLLAVLGGKANPTEKDVTAIIAAGGGKADAEQVKKLIAEFAGKTAEQVIAAGTYFSIQFLLRSLSLVCGRRRVAPPTPRPLLVCSLFLIRSSGKTKLSSVPSGGAAAAAAPAAAAKGGAAAAPAKAAAKAPEPEPEEEEAGGFSLFD
jgi:large subunit ribosomal protein LP2